MGNIFFLPRNPGLPCFRTAAKRPLWLDLRRPRRAWGAAGDRRWEKTSLSVRHCAHSSRIVERAAVEKYRCDFCGLTLCPKCREASDLEPLNDVSTTFLLSRMSSKLTSDHVQTVQYILRDIAKKHSRDIVCARAGGAVAAIAEEEEVAAAAVAVATA